MTVTVYLLSHFSPTLPFPRLSVLASVKTFLTHRGHDVMLALIKVIFCASALHQGHFQGSETKVDRNET